MAKHHAPEQHPARDRAAVRTVVLAMIGLTIFVVAMIASYSGAFAKPTLHHMSVAVAAPQQLVGNVTGPAARRAPLRLRQALSELANILESGATGDTLDELSDHLYHPQAS